MLLWNVYVVFPVFIIIEVNHTKTQIWKQNLFGVINPPPFLEATIIWSQA